MAWDLLDEDCADISDWNNADIGTGVSEVDPAGQLRLDTNAGAAGDAYAYRSRVIASPPNKLTIEIKTYFDDIGGVDDDLRMQYQTATWKFQVAWRSDGLFIYKAAGATGEVGTNIVVEGGSAAWQTWRFEIDKSGGEDVATVEVFLDDVSQGTVDCDWEVATTDGRVDLIQRGYNTNDMVSHVDYIKIETGIILKINVHDCGETKDKVGG